MSTDISNNDFVKQKRNPPLQDEMPEDERMDDKDSQNEYSETSEQLMNKENYFEYETRQDRLRSPLMPLKIVNIKETPKMN